MYFQILSFVFYIILFTEFIRCPCEKQSYEHESCSSFGANEANDHGQYDVRADSTNPISRCKTLRETLPSQRPPINKVGISDIENVYCFGDSLTAGFASGGSQSGNFFTALLESVINFSSFYEYQGSSYCSGCQSEQTRSISQFIKTLTRKSDNWKSCSRGKRHFRFCVGSCPSYEDIYTPYYDGLNGAISGAKAKDLEIELQYAFSQTDQSTVSKNWKLIFIMIGLNDVCKSTRGTNRDDFLKEYEKTILEVLLTIQTYFPYSIVQLIPLLDMSELIRWSEKQEREHPGSLSSYCPLHTYIRDMICPAIHDGGSGGSSTGAKRVSSLIHGINSVLDKIVKEKYTNSNGDPKYSNIAVTLSPHFKNMNMMKIPLEWMSSFDCIHMSEKGQGIFSAALWNNLFLNRTMKSTSVREYDLPVCPSMNTYISVY